MKKKAITRFSNWLTGLHLTVILQGDNTFSFTEIQGCIYVKCENNLGFVVDEHVPNDLVDEMKFLSSQQTGNIALYFVDKGDD